MPVKNQITTLSVVKIAIKFSPCGSRFSNEFVDTKKPKNWRVMYRKAFLEVQRLTLTSNEERRKLEERIIRARFHPPRISPCFPVSKNLPWYYRDALASILDKWILFPQLDLRRCKAECLFHALEYALSSCLCLFNDRRAFVNVFAQVAKRPVRSADTCRHGG